MPAAPQAAAKPEIYGDIEFVSQPVKKEEESKKKVGMKIYLPPSFMEATLLSGMYAPTTQTGKDGPMPALLRIKNLAILPNSVKCDLKGCFVMVEAHGSLADERAHARLTTLSCITRGGQSVIDQKIKGYIVDEDGFVGLRGKVVSKMGAAIARSLVAGFAVGFGDALNASAITTTVSGLGVTQTLDTDRAVKAGAGQGHLPGRARPAAVPARPRQTGDPRGGSGGHAARHRGDLGRGGDRGERDTEYLHRRDRHMCKLSLLLFLGIAIAALSSGCSTVGEAINPYSADFKCEMTENGRCISMTGAYLGSLQKDPGAQGTGRTARARKNTKKNAIDPPASAASETAYQEALFKKLSGLLEEPATPVIAPPKVMRVLLLPYKAEKDLFMYRYVYFVVDDYCLGPRR